MLDIQPGDVVFSHYKGKIVARGFVTKSAISSDQPLDLLKVGEGVWNNDGWLVEVEFLRTSNFFSPKENFPEVLTLLLEEYPKPIASRNPQGVSGHFHHDTGTRIKDHGHDLSNIKTRI